VCRPFKLTTVCPCQVEHCLAGTGAMLLHEVASQGLEQTGLRASGRLVSDIRAIASTCGIEFTTLRETASRIAVEVLAAELTGASGDATGGLQKRPHTDGGVAASGCVEQKAGSASTSLYNVHESACEAQEQKAGVVNAPMRIDQLFIAVHDEGVIVRTTIELSGSVVRTLPCSYMVRGIKVASATDGSKRVQLECGNWASIQKADRTNVLEALIDATPCDMHYVCISPPGVQVCTGVETTSDIADTVSFGQVVRGIMTARSSAGVLRLLLDDGRWTTFQSSTSCPHTLYFTPVVD